jgi:hypothetical protein
MNMSANLAEAIDNVRSNVDALIKRVAPGAPKAARADNSQQQSCTDREGAPTGEARSQVGYIVEGRSLDANAALQETREFFATQGFAVNTSRLTDDPPAVFAKGRGFNYSAIVNSVGDLVVGGTTPCFPPNETE